MENRLAFVGETRSAVRHQALALGGTNGLAEVGLARLAELALATFRGIQRDHVITRRDRGHTLADGFDNGSAFVTQDRREDAFRVGTGQGVGIGMAHTGGNDT
ncbi:hypothetical protein D3C78_881400 [compost metagenome]